MILFCLAPLGIFGPLQEGLLGSWKALFIKGVMDGLAAMGFVVAFGPALFLAIIPLIASQGTITLLAWSLMPFLYSHGLMRPLAATLGLLIFCVALIILEILSHKECEHLLGYR